jgi:hypothetical protein
MSRRREDKGIFSQLLFYVLKPHDRLESGSGSTSRKRQV